MSDVKFLIVLPTNPNESDRMSKFSVGGTLLLNPQEFSINFVNSTNCTDNITYHFKVNILEQSVIENYKMNGEWSGSHVEQYLNIFDGKRDMKIPKISPIKDGLAAVFNSSFTESSFSLDFQLDHPNSMINVYQKRGQGYNFVTKFETLFSLAEIQSVQVWGDVKIINHFAINYESDDQ